jgi:hypothetical protein
MFVISLASNGALKVDTMQVNERNVAEIVTGKKAASRAKKPAVPPSLFISALWKTRKWIGIVTLGCIMAAFIIVALLPRKYVATAVIAPPSESSGGTGGLSAAMGLGALVGGFSGGTTNFTKFLQLVQSDRLAASLEYNHHVLRTMNPQAWDDTTKSWRKPSGPIFFVKSALKSLIGRPSWEAPNTNRLADTLSKLVRVSPASTNNMLEISAFRNQITVVSVTYSDRNYAVALLNNILEDSDAIARRDRLETISNRVKYLQAVAENTTDVNLTNSIASLLLDQERALMMLKADRYYAFDMIDPPHAEITPIGTKPTTVIFALLLLGISTWAGVVYWLLNLRLAEVTETGEDPLARPLANPFKILVAEVKALVVRP